MKKGVPIYDCPGMDFWFKIGTLPSGERIASMGYPGDGGCNCSMMETAPGSNVFEATGWASLTLLEPPLDDPEDGGKAENCITAKLTIGDPSSSFTERWEMRFTNDETGVTRRHCNTDYGTPFSDEHAFVKGRAYTFWLLWTDTLRVAGSSADFDYQCLVNDSDASGIYQGLYGTGTFIIEDKSKLLTTLTHGHEGDPTVGKTGKIYVPAIQASAIVADNSPQKFKAFKTEFGNPCAAPNANPGQALAVFYKDVQNPDYSVKNFDIDLKFIALPDSIPNAPPYYAYWSKKEGPNSGALSLSVGKAVKFQNPKEGGLYKFECDLVGLNQPTNGVNVLLPLGGPDVTKYFMSEVKRYDAWYTAMEAEALNPPPLTPATASLLSYSMNFADTILSMLHKTNTYVSGHSPCKRYCNHTVTIAGHVFGKDHLGNFLFSYCAAKAKFSLGFTTFGANVVARFKDNPDDQAAYVAGHALGLNPNGDFKTILETCGTPISDMQTEPARRGWPSKDVAEGTTFPIYGGKP